MNTKFIPLSVPNFEGNEEKYVNDAVKSTWVSTGGGYVTKFEEALAQYVKMPQAVATASGTAALHLALIVAGVGRGDEVIAATLTFIAAVNPIKYAGAEPIFVDCDDYLCMDPKSVRAFLEANCEIRDGKTYNKNTGVMLRIDHGISLIFLLCVIWFFRSRPRYSTIGGAAGAMCCTLFSIFYLASPLSFLVIHFYNGEPGENNRLVTYLAYPVLLLAIGLVGILAF